MNIVYFCNFNLFANNSLSLKKKVYGQLDAFKKKGFKIYLITINKLKYSIIDINNDTKNEYIYLNKESLYLDITNLIVKFNPKIIYVRHSITGFFLIQFYRLLKNNCKNTKMIIEFPTIPYDGEMKSNGRTSDIIDIDRFYRQQLKDFFDISINFNGLNEVFGIQSIPTKNGIMLKQIPIKSNKTNDKKEISLIGLATLHSSNGYERVLHGIYEYYNKYYKKYKYTIRLNIVGIGPSLFELEETCDNYKINKYTSFLGLLDGKELDDIFEKSDIALGSLGFYKNGIKNGSPLKTKEYCARGIPFIIGYDDLSFNEDVEYIMKVENDNTPIDMCKVIDFYEFTQNKNNLPYIMRDFAERNLSWDHCFESVLKFILL